jgi:hypothetical protein
VTQERRKYPRTKPPNDYVLAVSTAEMETTAGRRLNLAVKFVDMCPKGALVVTVGRLREGVQLNVEITRTRSDYRFRGKAVVRWSQTWTRGGREAEVAGIEFTEVTEVRGEEMKFFASWARGSAGLTDASQRQHPRIAPSDCTASCFAGGMLGYSSKNIARRLIDLSEGGAQLDLLEKLDPGKKVKIHLVFKTSGEMEAEGEVCWCKRNTMVLEPHFLAGIKFTRVTEENLHKIRTVAVLYLAQGGAKSVEEGPPVNLV